MSDIINGTVQAFSLLTLEPTPNGYQICWAIYVKTINWLTPLYMARIDPFRRRVVYPIMIKQLERI